MNVTLIIPPSPFLINEKLLPSLGILKVASSLRYHGYNTKICDLSGCSNYELDVISYINNNHTEVIGITSTTPQFPYSVNISKLIKKNFPNIKQILGGPHATLTYSSLKRNFNRSKKNWNSIIKNFDVVVSGDGEYSVLNAIQPNSPSIINADDTKSKLFLTNKSFSELPIPARDLIDINSYNFVLENIKCTSIISQLGCPFSCRFCSGRYSPSFKKIRLRSVESIINEILYIHSNYGYKGFIFYDDELNSNVLMTSLMKELIKLRNKGHDFVYRGCIKSNLLTDEQSLLISEAGFKEILVGFESGNEKILFNINKGSTVKNNEKCIELLRKYKIKIKFLMSIGHPGESEKTCSDTYNWLLNMKPECFDVTIVTPHPGSIYYDDSILVKNEWVYTCPNNDVLYSENLDYTVISDFYKGIPGKYKPHIHTDYLSSVDLSNWRDYIENSIKYKLNISGLIK